MNMIRIVGSETWIGVDVTSRTLFMKKEDRITDLADFRSTEAAELVDMWLETIGRAFAPARRRKRERWEW